MTLPDTRHVQTAWGASLLVIDDDRSIDSVLFSEGRWKEYHEDEALTSIIKPGDTVLDVGANVGYHTLLASRLVGPEGLVIACEPEPTNLSVLGENVHRNEALNVLMLPIGLGAKVEERSFFVSSTNKGRHSLFSENTPNATRRSIVVTTIDKLIALLPSGRQPDVIKLDVEGAEGLVLAGGRQFLENAHPKIWMEFWPVGIQASSVDPLTLLQDMERFGYRVQLCDTDVPLHDSNTKEVMEYLEKKPTPSTHGGTLLAHLLFTNKSS